MSLPAPLQRWVLCPQPQPAAKLRLLCFPYAGSGPAIFHKWPAFLPPEVEMWGIRFPGRETRIREPAFDSLGPLVTAVSEALQPHLDRPSLIFGHSLGALVGYELAQQWQKQNGPQLLHLLISGHRAPHRPPLQPPVHHADDKTFLNRIRKLGGTHNQFFTIPELVALMLPTLRADFAVCENYRYDTDIKLDVPITAFGSEADSEAKVADILAWEQHTRNSFSYHIYPGGHFYFQENLTSLLAEISDTLRAYSCP